MTPAPKRHPISGLSAYNTDGLFRNVTASAGKIINVMIQEPTITPPIAGNESPNINPVIELELKAMINANNPYAGKNITPTHPAMNVRKNPNIKAIKNMLIGPLFIFNLKPLIAMLQYEIFKFYVNIIHCKICEFPDNTNH